MASWWETPRNHKQNKSHHLVWLFALDPCKLTCTAFMFLYSNRCSLSKSGLNRVLPFDNLPAEVCQKQTKIASHTKATNSEKWSQCKVPKPAVPLKTTRGGLQRQVNSIFTGFEKYVYSHLWGGFLNPPPAAILHTPCQCVSLTCTLKLKKSEYNFYFHEVYVLCYVSQDHSPNLLASNFQLKLTPAR